MIADGDPTIVCFQTGREVVTVLGAQISEPSQTETIAMPHTRPQTHLEMVLNNHRWLLIEFYAEHGEPKNDHEKIEVLIAYLNAPKNLDLGNLELRLLWVKGVLSDTELSYFV